MTRLERDMRERQDRRGFTLAEVVIVVLILGIVARIALPRFAAGMAQRQAASLARRLVMDIDTVRQVARASSASKSLTLDATDQSYTLNGIESPDRKSAAHVVRLTDFAPFARLGTISLGGDSTLIFNGFGCPDSGGSVQIVIGPTTKTVVIDALTGSATIQ